MYFYWSNSIDYFVVEDLDIHNEKYKTILKNNLDRHVICLYFIVLLIYFQV